MKHVSLFAILAFGLLSSGCAGTNPIRGWQGQVENVVARDGRVSFERLYRYADDTAGRTRPGLVSVRALDIPGGGVWPFIGRRDVVGVLVGTGSVNQMSACAFLVGVVELDLRNTGQDDVRHRLTDLRLAVAKMDSNRIVWSISEKNDPMIQRYATGGVRNVQGLQLYPFPNPTDRYELQIGNSTVRCAEQRSGVVMDLPIN